MTKTTPTIGRRLRHSPLRDLIRGRITGRLDISALLDNCDLPKDATDCVGRVVKRTRLWRLEKIDLADELLAHFLDGLEAGTPVAKLLTDFGDEKQAARLIRRAKIRQRPWLWHVMRWCGRSLACLTVFYLVLVAYYFSGSPTVSVNYLAKLNARGGSAGRAARAPGRFIVRPWLR
jgi:hypothetical protein